MSRFHSSSPFRPKLMRSPTGWRAIRMSLKSCAWWSEISSETALLGTESQATKRKQLEARGLRMPATQAVLTNCERSRFY